MPSEGLTTEKDASYYEGLNTRLLKLVPNEAREILEVGCAEGRLGAALRELVPGRRVFGIEREKEPAAKAARVLDKVFVIDLEKETPDLPRESLDCILFGDVLEHLHDPVEVLRRLRPLVAQNGCILCCIPNVQHHSILTQLIRGDFQYQLLGLLDATHIRFFTFASFLKVLLDAGFAPTLRDAISILPNQTFINALMPVINYLRADPTRTIAYLSAYQLLFQGTPLGWDEVPETPLSFVVCVNDEDQLRDNLLASPCFRGDTIHDVVCVRGAQNAAEGFAAGLSRAIHEWVVFVHQDVYLPAGWPARLVQQLRSAEKRHAPLGIAGVFGANYSPGNPNEIVRKGHVVDRHTLLRTEDDFPVLVQTLDELLIVVPRATILRIDPKLGWHFYGADLALQAQTAGFSTVALDAPVFHNSLTGSTVPEAFHTSAAVFRDKWKEILPVATPCVVVR
jgi:SAM-dependent methyltransferase